MVGKLPKLRIAGELMQVRNPQIYMLHMFLKIRLRSVLKIQLLHVTKCLVPAAVPPSRPYLLWLHLWHALQLARRRLPRLVRHREAEARRLRPKQGAAE